MDGQLLYSSVEWLQEGDCKLAIHLPRTMHPKEYIYESKYELNVE